MSPFDTTKRPAALNRRLLGMATMWLAMTSQAADFLTPKQKAEAAELGKAIEQQCLIGSTPPANAPPSVKMMMDWAKEPQSCSCLGASVRDAVTLQFFILKEQDARQWLIDKVATSTMKCSLPITRKKFSEQCEALFTADASQKTAQAIKPESLTSTCNCAREALGKMTDKQLIDTALQRYSDYLERRQTGNPPAQRPKSPIEDTLERCLTSERK